MVVQLLLNADLFILPCTQNYSQLQNSMHFAAAKQTKLTSGQLILQLSFAINRCLIYLFLFYCPLNCPLRLIKVWPTAAVQWSLKRVLSHQHIAQHSLIFHLFFFFCLTNWEQQHGQIARLFNYYDHDYHHDYHHKQYHQLWSKQNSFSSLLWRNFHQSTDQR